MTQTHVTHGLRHIVHAAAVAGRSGRIIPDSFRSLSTTTRCPAAAWTNALLGRHQQGEKSSTEVFRDREPKERGRLLPPDMPITVPYRPLALGGSSTIPWQDSKGLQHHLAGNSQDHWQTQTDATSERQITDQLYGLLRVHAGSGRTDEVRALVEELVCKRQEPPNLKLYAALILVNVNIEFGSAAEVARLLKEMADEGLAADAAVYHNALQALAIHPDPLLRDQVIREMRDRWVNLNERGWHDLVAGYVRDGLLEQALDGLAQMQQAKITIGSWLKDMIVYSLCDNNELDQVLRLVKDRVAAGEVNMSASIWYYVFDHACSELHYDTIHFIWRRRIDSKYLNPNTGQCLRALTIAARVGDIHIATDVFRVLSQRGTTFTLNHYELLMEAHIQAGDLRTALTILCIMHGVNMKPSISSLTSLHKYLKDDSARPEQAFAILKELRTQREVPTVAVNCIMDSLVDQKRHEDVISTYKSLHKICVGGPDIYTFNIIFRSCAYANDKPTAMFFAAEMIELKIRPDLLTYDRLVLVCLKEGNYEDAFRYYADMLDAGFIPRNGTISNMIRVCCDARDRRAFDLVRKMRDWNMPTAPQVKMLQDQWPDRTQEELGSL